MKPKSLYRIEYFSDALHKWQTFGQFNYMQKSFAEGAWAMLRSYYNNQRKHRLLKDGIVVEEMGLQTIHVN